MIVRGVTFRCYDLPVSFKTPEVTVEDEVISCNVPDEMTDVEEARAWGEALLAAADELEAQQTVGAW
jgi:hypothetical protein